MNNIADAMVTGLPHNPAEPSVHAVPVTRGSREHLMGLLGLSHFTKSSGECWMLSLEDRGEYFQADLQLETEPGVVMPFFLLLPASALPSAPVASSISSAAGTGFPWDNLPENMETVIVPHGHGSDGRYGVCGIDRHSKMSETRLRYSHDLGVQLVKQEYMVIAPDARGSGDRRIGDKVSIATSSKNIETLLSSDCNGLSFALGSLGASLAGAWVWDLMALMDLLVSRKQGGNVSVCGFSGGGLQSLYFAAMDSRVKAAVVSGYFFKYKDCHLHTNLCGCNFIPGYNTETDLGETAALIAPRPLMIQKGVNDPLNGRRGIEGPRELSVKVRDAYTAAGCPENFEFSEFDGEHRFEPATAYPFLEMQRNDA